MAKEEVWGITGPARAREQANAASRAVRLQPSPNDRVFNPFPSPGLLSQAGQTDERGPLGSHCCSS